MARFGSGGGGPAAAARQLKELVRALHGAGIEVILDVVYNHTVEGAHVRLPGTAPRSDLSLFAPVAAAHWAGGLGRRMTPERSKSAVLGPQAHGCHPAMHMLYGRGAVPITMNQVHQTQCWHKKCCAAPIPRISLQILCARWGAGGDDDPYLCPGAASKTHLLHDRHLPVSCSCSITSGCGNTVSGNHPVTQRMIVDSLQACAPPCLALA